MYKSYILRFIILLMVGLSIAGCRESQQQTENTSEIDIELQINPDPAVVGESMLFVTLTDPNADNAPVEDASISVRGDMNHAGMVPVLREADDFSQESPGVYTTPFEWTMGGEWFVVVNVTFPDDTTIEREFALSVSGDGDDNMESMDMSDMEATEEMNMDMGDIDMETTEESDNG